MILRPIQFWLLMLLLGGAALQAAEGPALDEGSLDAGQGVIDRKSGHWHFCDKVHLVVPGTLELWCEDLVVNQSTDSKGKRTTDRIVARTNVVMLIVSPTSGDSQSIVMKPGETNRATAFQATFDAVQGTVELTGTDATGQPQVEGPDAAMRAASLSAGSMVPVLGSSNSL